MKKTAAFVLAILASLAFLVNPGFGALPRYEITDLGTLGGGYGYAGAIDNAAALAGDSCIIDSVNADEIQVPNAFWSASELGWLYTPGFSYILTGVLTNLGNSHIDGTSPLVTLEVYDGLPVEDANLLRSAQFHPADRSWAGGHFDPLVLTAGEHYFIGFRNVKDLWASHSYDGVPLPIYYGYDNDGTYPFTENGDVEYAMLKFQGTHIHPLRVPADYPTIQAAIDAAVDGDTVLVADGTYTGTGNRNINFLGKAIFVRSESGAQNCIIDCQASYFDPQRGFYFNNREDESSVLDGFTVIHGCVPGGRGGAIYCGGGSSPMIINCIISDNRAPTHLYYEQKGRGGGIYCGAASPTIRNCAINSNMSTLGGGIYCNYSSPTIDNCTFSENRAGGDYHSNGGAMYNHESSPMLTNCTFSGNSASDCGGGVYNAESNPTLSNAIFMGNSAEEGGGMYNYSGSPILNNCTFSANLVDECGAGVFNYSGSPTLINCILWGGVASDGDPIGEIYVKSGAPGVTYNNVQGGWAGQGNIDADPLFVEAGYWHDNGTPDNHWDDYWVEGDYHLLPGSPCIDAGAPNYVAEPNETDLDGKPRVIGGRIDMGAYESPVPAEVKIVPRSINLASKGKWITAFLWLPEEYNVADIEPNSVLLEGEIKPESLKIDEEQQVAVVRFSRSDVQEILNVGDIELTITGRLTDGTVFEGTDIIKVLNKAGKK